MAWKHEFLLLQDLLLKISLQVFNMVRKEDWYKPDVYLYREMIDTLGKNKLIEV